METEIHSVTVDTTTKPLFYAGTVMVMSEAEDMLNKLAKGRDGTTKLIGVMIGRHITGDFGLMPADNVAENIRRIATGGDCLMSCYMPDGSRTEPYKYGDEPADSLINLLTLSYGGEIVTYVASNAEVSLLFMARTLKNVASRALKPGINLAGITPAGNA